MLLSFERPLVGAFAFEKPRATLLHRNGLVLAVLPESDWIMRKRTIEVPQELFPVVSTFIPGGVPGDQLQACVTALVAQDRNRVHAWYRRAKATKQSGTGGRKS